MARLKTERERERVRERERESERAIGMVQLSAIYADVARILNCTKLTITRLIQRYRVTGRTADRPRSGRPCVTTANEDHHLCILHLRNTFLTRQHRLRHLRWARQFQHWQHWNWQRVLFSDESRNWIHIKPGENITKFI